MRTLNIAISDVEYHKFGLTHDTLNFSDLVDMVSRELMRQHLDSAVNAAETRGLSSLSMDDISREVQAARAYAKGNAGVTVTVFPMINNGSIIIVYGKIK